MANNISVSIIDKTLLGHKTKNPEIEKGIVKSINTLSELEEINFNLTGQLEIEIMFVTKQEMAKLNLKFRGKSCPTDVLSFPQSQFSNLKINSLGSIVVCQKVVEEKNEKINEAVKHGLLHLFGYDHDKNIKGWRSAAKTINCNF